ncbi:FKBP-type peptidyl-prolyl cis-trans isomerase [Bacteroides sp. 214]|uniref:FKBP-type peptidyl-prolyl cis-trans isomerase n=1 Tax=Bacteroides sp. 214 TaxID=2302935 RepID=UPI0013D61122|nr:FKBP-type peptidyl-prolyl cis-trans isomerase [Bacteroides sp. 214]NDW12994.1 FKBP-type peptidyl-prolyl cis-trans isomerase [Bacteroides sp. 214]
MKKIALIVTALAGVVFTSCTAQAPKENLKTEVDSLSYAIGIANTQGLLPYLAQNGVDSTQMADFVKGVLEGVNATSKSAGYEMGLGVGRQIKDQMLPGINSQVFKNDSVKKVSKDNFIAGFIAATLGKKTAMNLEGAQAYVQQYMEEQQSKDNMAQFADNKKAGEDFLAANKGKEGVITTESGLQYKVIKEGKGEIPTVDSKVRVNYRGTLIDGTEFDASKEPITFPVTGVIAGWTEALQLMPVGSKWELYIPQELAYKATQRGSDIKPFSALVFEIELLGIE